jgi:ABC-type transport system substrate-binding protein
VFARNQRYWRPGLPYAAALEIIDFPDTVSLADALITGQADAAGTMDGPPRSWTPSTPTAPRSPATGPAR